MIKVSIESVRASLLSQHRVVVLKEEGMERYLAIWIGALASALMAVLRIALLFSGRATEASAPTTAD